MNFSYIRKTDRPVDEAVAAFRSSAKARNISIQGEAKLEAGVILSFAKKEWTEAVMRAEPDLLGMVPAAAYIVQKDGRTWIALGNARLLGGLSPLPEMRTVAEEMDSELRALVDEASGAGAPVIKKVKLYSTATCPYCKMEKSYLDSKGVNHEVLMVDENRQAGEEMVRKTGQMGVPVTEVEYEDGGSEFVIGFDKPRLAALLDLKDGRTK